MAKIRVLSGLIVTHREVEGGSRGSWVGAGVGSSQKIRRHTFWKDLCDNCQHIYWAVLPIR